VQVYVETVPTVETKTAVQLPDGVTAKVGRTEGATAFTGTVIVPVKVRLVFGKAVAALGETARVAVALATVVEAVPVGTTEL
jgi:hypothetical protein